MAGHLGKSLREIEELDSHELAHWIAYHRFFRPLDDSWQQAGLIAAATVSPYSKRGHTPKPSDFIPIEQRPQTQQEMAEALRRLKTALGK